MLFMYLSHVCWRLNDQWIWCTRTVMTFLGLVYEDCFWVFTDLSLICSNWDLTVVICCVPLTTRHLYANSTFPPAVWISQKQPQQKWKLTGNQLANKGCHCRHFSNAQFVKDPNEISTVTHRDVFASRGYFQLRRRYRCIGWIKWK